MTGHDSRGEVAAGYRRIADWAYRQRLTLRDSTQQEETDLREGKTALVEHTIELLDQLEDAYAALATYLDRAPEKPEKPQSQPQPQPRVAERVTGYLTGALSAARHGS